MPQAASAAAVFSPTAATLRPEKARASRPYSSNFSRTALHRVDRGERDPLVAALDQAADGLVHLLRVARRLDRDGRHLLGHRAVAAQPRGQRAGLLLGARHQHPPAEQRLGLEPRQRLAQVDDRRRRR